MSDVEWVAMSRHDVLDVLRVGYELEQKRPWRRGKQSRLEFDTTINKWLRCRSTWKVKPIAPWGTDDWWEDLVDGLNDLFTVEVQYEDWWEALFPTGVKTVGDVCALISRHASKPLIRPWQGLGSNCLPAGCFLTLCGLLEETGENVNDLAPSKPLRDIEAAAFEPWIEKLRLVAPKTFERVFPYPNTLTLTGIAIAVFGFLLLLFGKAIGEGVFIVTFVGILLRGIRMVSRGSELPAGRIEFGSYKTLGDLARAMAAEQAARGSPIA